MLPCQTACDKNPQIPEDFELLRAPWSRVGPDLANSTTTPPHIPRRAAITAGPIALAAALSACSSAPSRTSATRRSQANTPDLRDLRDARNVTVAGERLNAALLRQFYARHGYEYVWASRPAMADAMMEVVQRAGDHGLDPELFHASLLERRDTFTALRREVLLSHAFLTYADLISAGAMPPDRRRDNEAITPDPIDIAAALDTIIARPNPAAALEALAPATPTYQALQQALKGYRDGTIPAPRPGPPPGPVRIGRRWVRPPAPPRITVADRIRTLEVNLERERWLPRPLPADRIWVNVTDESLVVFRDNEPVFTTRVIVGDIAPVSQSPEFNTVIQGAYFNPPWVVPADIVERAYLPRIARDPNFLARHNMELRPNGEIEQKPGPDAGLGVIMFNMPNRFDVYLHDTPDRHLFNRPNRRLSNGCIRVQNPIAFAALVMQQSADAINEGIAEPGTTHHPLRTPMPVFVTYRTAFADDAGEVAFREDFYSRDADVWDRIPRRGAASVGV